MAIQKYQIIGGPGLSDLLLSIHIEFSSLKDKLDLEFKFAGKGDLRCEFFIRAMSVWMNQENSIVIIGSFTEDFDNDDDDRGFRNFRAEYDFNSRTGTLTPISSGDLKKIATMFGTEFEFVP